MNQLARLILYTTVFITGAAVLIMEIAAVRLLSPYFGSTLYVLSSVLTTILLALAVGYYVGGKLSDRFPYHTPLYWIITISGLILLVLTLTATVLLPFIGPQLSLMYGPLFMAFGFFFIPALLLGIDSPYVIKLLSINIADGVRGEVVGATFFWSTAGSITGSLLAGFYFIPQLGLQTTLLLVSWTLILVGLLGNSAINYLQTATLPKNKTVGTGVFLFFCLFISYIITDLTNSTDTLYEAEGYYSNIKVYENTYFGQPVRRLQRDVNHSSAVYLDSTDLVFPYAQFSLLYQQLIPNPQSFLLLGGGAYTIATAVHELNPDMKIDVVEIESSLHPLAIEYFHLPETKQITNHVSDARAYLLRQDTLYDVIFFDAFGSGYYIPTHLATEEFLHIIREHLSEDGVLITNFIGRPYPHDKQTLTGSYVKTLQSVFPNTLGYAMFPNHLSSTQNLIFISRKEGKEIDFATDTTIRLENTIATPLEYFELPLHNLVADADKIFTDNHAPTDLLLIRERIFNR